MCYTITVKQKIFTSEYLIYIYIYIYIRYSEVKIHYLKYFGMLPSSVNLFLFQQYKNELTPSRTKYAIFTIINTQILHYYISNFSNKRI